MATKRTRLCVPKFQKSLLALAIIGGGYSASAYSQEVAQKAVQASEAEAEDAVELIEVRGMRANITAAQALKRYANTVIDSISAEDLGDFPDKSVADALQRVPGVSVERFASRTDTKAFSVEPSGVIVRGLPQVRSEFNGRDSFSANSSRGLSWGDISPELMGGIDVYKNQTAELIEGGIAGLINLRTRLPFDLEGETKILNVSANYSDMSDSVTPDFSGIYTNRFATDVGEFGIMANVAYSDVDATAQTSRLGRMMKFRGVYNDDDSVVNYIPDTAVATDAIYSRQRLGTSLAAQWRDTDDTMVASLQYNRSQKKNANITKGIQVGMPNPLYEKSVFLEIVPGGEGSNGIATAADGSDAFMFNEDGLFQTGKLVQPHGWWGSNNADSALRAANSNGDALVETCAGEWAGCGPELTTRGLDFATYGETGESKTVTEDLGFNFEWHITDKIHRNFDLQYVKATTDSYNIRSGLTSAADATIDLTGEQFSVVLDTPTNVNLVDAGQGILGNPNSYYLANIMDIQEDSEGTEFAAKADFVFDIYNEVVERVKVGVRYADRKQQVNQAFNWDSVVNYWTDNTAAFFNLDSAPTSGQFNGQDYNFSGYPNAYVVDSWDASYGNFATADGNNMYVFPNIADMKNWKNTMGAASTGIPLDSWNPTCSGLGNRSDEVDGGCFLPVEMIDVGEETKAVYVQVDFGGDDFMLFGKELTGNIGVRYVETDIYSTGGEKFPTISAETMLCEEKEVEAGQPAPDIPKSLGCYLDAGDIAFSNNAGNLGNGSASHENLLPSLNLRMDVTDSFVTRFALSRAMSRPDIGSLRNYISVSTGLPDTNDITDSRWVKNDAGEVVGANLTYTGKASNPKLKPITADQMDLSFEYYSDSGATASLALFYKRFKDYIQTGRYYRDLTNNGVTKTVEVTGPLNGDGASVRGFEIQGTKFFDFLPEPFNGIGVQANYTFIDNQGVKNTGVNSASAEGNTLTGQAPDQIEVDRLEGMSDHAYNLTLMYEKEGLSARMAYSWRSEYVVTVSDCCIALPVWQDAYGQLDASLQYDINETIKVSLAATNLLGEESVLTQQVDNSADGAKRLPYSTNQSDTRYTLSLRMSF